MTLMDGKIKTAQDRLCIIGINSLPTPERSADHGAMKYKIRAKKTPNPVMNLKKLRIKGKNYALPHAWYYT